MNIVVPLNALGDAVEKDIEKKTRKLIVSIFANLDVASPIGRPELWLSAPSKDYRPGWFKANWKIVAGHPDGSPADPERRGKGSDGQAKLFKIGMDMHILNNAPYAERLGKGWSTQAPLGWLDIAIKAGIRYGTR